MICKSLPHLASKSHLHQDYSSLQHQGHRNSLVLWNQRLFIQTNSSSSQLKLTQFLVSFHANRIYIFFLEEYVGVHLTLLRIRWGLKGNYKLILVLICENVRCDSSVKHLMEAAVISGHNICFNGEMWKIIPKLSPLPLHIWYTASKKKKKIV